MDEIRESLNEEAGSGSTLTGHGGGSSTKLVFGETKRLNDSLDISGALLVESGSLAHNQEAFEVP